MKDLLKEAIADAKAVRETALANAKLALEEAFTPRLQSMISAKLSEEMDEEEPMEEEEEMHASEEEMPTPEPAEAEAEGDDDMMDDDDSEEMDEMDEDDLDLDEIIRELEMAEELDSSDIGTGDNKVDDLEADTDYDDDLFAEGEDEMMDEDEEIDIQEVIRALREEDDDEMTEEGMKRRKKKMMEMDHEEESMEEAEHGEELEEAYNVIRFLKGKINEVNLLNAKLLYSNKLFRNFSLNESQKMKVIENFDRAFNLREVKLVYSTLAESFKSPAVARKIVRESFASKPVASTKPAKQVISEGADLANRFQKLAGLIK